MPYQVTAPDGLTATAVVYVPGTGDPRSGSSPARGSPLRPDGSVTRAAQHGADRHLGPASSRSPRSTSSPPPRPATSPSTRTRPDRLPGARARRLHRSRRGHRAGLRRRQPAGPARQHGHGDDPGPGRPGRADAALPAGRAAGRRGRRPQTYDIGQLCHVWVDTTIEVAAAALHPGLGHGGWRGRRHRHRRHQPAADRRERRQAWRHREPADHPGRRDRGGHGGHRRHERRRCPPAGPSPPGPSPADSVTVDLSQYVTSPLAQPDIQVLRVTHPAGATVRSSGSDGHDHARGRHPRRRHRHRVSDRRARPRRPGDQRRDHGQRHRPPGPPGPPDRDGREPHPRGVVRPRRAQRRAGRLLHRLHQRHPAHLPGRARARSPG